MSKKLILFTTASILFLMNFLYLNYAFSMDKFYLRVPMQMGGIEQKFSATEQESIKQFKEKVSEIIRYYNKNVFPFIRSIEASSEVKILIGVHIFSNDLHRVLAIASLLPQFLKHDKLTLSIVLEKTGTTLESLNRFISMIEVFTTEENLSVYAKTLLASDKKERKELAELINTNDKFRQGFANIMEQYYEYIKGQLAELQKIKDYFEQRDRDIKSQIQHLVPAEDL